MSDRKFIYERQSISRSGRQGRLAVLCDPAGYIDGANRFEFVGDDAVGLVDPAGLDAASTQPTTQPIDGRIDLTVQTGSANKESPWLGATWTLYVRVPNDKDNPGRTQLSVRSVSSSTDGCKVKLSATIRIQIEIRNLEDFDDIKNVDGKRVLTEQGRQVYGHEQLHVHDFTDSVRALCDNFAKTVTDGVDPADAKIKAANAERALRVALNDWAQARQPQAPTDISHGGTGQPLSGVGYPPEGEPGPYAPQ